MNETNTLQQTVTIVDDESVVRQAFCNLFDNQKYNLQQFISAEQLLSNLDSLCRGCLIVDLRLPGMSGLELQQELTERGVRNPVIFISGFGDVPTAVEAMRCGAMDFIEKPIESKDLLDCIERAMAVEQKQYQDCADRTELKRRLGTVSNREKQVFDCVVEGLTNKAIAKQLAISERTVEVHRSQVMQKMNAGTLAGLIRMHVELCECN